MKFLWMRLPAIVAVLLCGLAAAALADKPLKGVALVIGQSRYEHVAPLANPANDARAMAKLLGDLGFTVTATADRDARRLRRDLENFAADAEDADVAAVYYSGHGIEAGGENWLVPVDADLAALEDAGRTLVPLSSLLDQLQSTVPLTLLFLDACRSNPFPAGATLTRDGAAVPVNSTGLAAVRGVIAADQSAGRGLGTVIGFAAEPGKAALDGPEGGNGPYAAALLRHLSAMDGLEFGTVMRMVTEEVYLRTQGRQRPWVNESLTRLIYLGAPVARVGDDAGRILTERRQLLLTIAALPGLQRTQVEAAAQAQGVPMDALYGLLKSLGADVPSDPQALASLLAVQAERVKAVLAAQRSLESPDPEIARLSALAGEALKDGALDANLAFWQQAKARYAELAGKLDETEQQLKARRLEGGEVLAHAAAAYELKAGYRAAAENYKLAFAQVAKWDAARARTYKRNEADAWFSQGDVLGDNEALDTAISLFSEALALSPRQTAADDWARVQNNLGNALLVRGNRSTGTADIEKAMVAYRAALEERRRDRVPRDWAKTQNNLAIAYADLAERTGDPQLLTGAIAAYRAALSETPRAEDPLVWAAIMNNLGNALQAAGNEHLEEAIAAHRAALEEKRRDLVPLDWAGVQTNLGNALAAFGRWKRDVVAIDKATAAYRLALEERTRARMPLEWAAIQYNLGNALGDKALLETGPENLAASVAAYRLALIERSFERTPLAWAETQYNLGRRLWQWGGRSFDAAKLAEAVAALKASLRVYTRSRDEVDWAAAQFNLANALADLGLMTGNAVTLREAIAAYHAALEVQTRVAMPLDWAAAQNNLGSALRGLGELEHAAATAREGRAAVAGAAKVYAKEGYAEFAPLFAKRLADFDAAIAKLGD